MISYYLISYKIGFHLSFFYSHIQYFSVSNFSDLFQVSCNHKVKTVEIVSVLINFDLLSNSLSLKAIALNILTISNHNNSSSVNTIGNESSERTAIPCPPYKVSPLSSLPNKS